jgi:plastocyanin
MLPLSSAQANSGRAVTRSSIFLHDRPKLAVFMLLSLVGACAGHDAAPMAALPTIRLTDTFQFDPERLVIHAGDTVEWRNVSRFKHSVTGDPAQGNAALPPGATPFASGDIQPGGSFRQRFAVAGRYRYVCTPHEGIGMMAEIEVLP